MRKRLLAVFSFIIIVALMWNMTFSTLSYKDTGGGGGFQNFYATDQGLIDVLILGSSHAHCSVNNAKLWEDAGIASFTLSSGNQSIDTTWTFLNEAFKTQHPKAVFIETYTFRNTTNDTDLANVYRANLLPKWSTSVIRNVLAQKNNSLVSNTLMGELMLRFPVIHSRYEELSEQDYYNDYWYKRGYIGSFDTAPVEHAACTDSRTELNDKTIKYIDMIVDKCNKEGAKPFFFCAPYSISEEEYAYQNALSDYLAEKNVFYINMNSPEASLGIDYDSDFRGDDHLNNSGAAKVTDCIEKIISDEGLAKDHRGDEAYKTWDYDAVFLRDRELYHNLSNNSWDIASYLDCFKDEDSRFKFVVAFSGDYTAFGEASYAMLESIGISADAYEDGGIFVVSENSSIVHYPAETKGNISLGKNDCSVTYTADGKCQLFYRLDEFAEIENGLIVFVYDTTLDCPLDVVYLDFYNSGPEVIRNENVQLIGN
ncbi:hypothetical protein [Butyrivibrio proteoclasticus]|uniref:hypothetical protein n=1 Tax=Butyrivibrio proteoclasticus TaxID=43305 RepID=UPI00047BE6DB|nr:hypothetical protein [Butyrivibrio proteoclasticus]